MFKKMALCLLTIASLLNTVPAQAFTVTDYLPSPKDAVKTTAVAALFAATLRFYTREGGNKPARYNLDELFVGENVTDNLFYLLDDGLIGHKGRKPYAMIDMESGRLTVSSAAYPKGLGGWFHYYFKSILTAVGITATLVIVAQIAADTTEGTFCEKFVERTKHLGTGFFKFSDAGLNVFLGTPGKLPIKCVQR
ncbi:MAG: hypothetical protein NTX86_00445 [Candidatus Dependentiae bacterium]|nr:hypothetical protein [Candidatus Dependentiae bacterium]